MKWTYRIAWLYHESECKQCRDERGKPIKSHDALNIFDGKHWWVEAGLNELGSQGWELVTTIGGTPGFSSVYGYFIFKKPAENQ